jgi:hypothetical protein
LLKKDCNAWTEQNVLSEGLAASGAGFDGVLRIGKQSRGRIGLQPSVWHQLFQDENSERPRRDFKRFGLAVAQHDQFSETLSRMFYLLDQLIDCLFQIKHLSPVGK